MDLNPLSTYADSREQAVADAEFILNTLVGKANGLTEYPEGTPVEAGDAVQVTEKYFGDDMAKVWRYLVEETVVVSVPRNSFFANTSRMQTVVGNQPVAVSFNEATSTITLETKKV